jgi:hypothetical protein
MHGKAVRMLPVSREEGSGILEGDSYSKKLFTGWGRECVSRPLVKLYKEPLVAFLDFVDSSGGADAQGGVVGFWGEHCGISHAEDSGFSRAILKGRSVKLAV